MRTTFSILIVFFLSACTDKADDKLRITGSIQHLEALKTDYPWIGNSGNITVVLYEIPFGGDAQPVAVDSATVPVNGKKVSFTLEATDADQGMYDIVVGEGPVIPLVNDSEKLEVDVDFSKKEPFYTVSGSKASEALRNFIVNYNAKNEKLDASMDKLNEMKQTGSQDSLLIVATDEKNKILQDLNNYVKTTLANTNNPTVASFVLGRGAKTFGQNDFETELNKAVKKFPEDPNLTNLQQTYQTYKKQAEERESKRKEKSWVGKPAPALSMPDVNGKNVSLKSFLGKYVLVDFWASWCGPCRQENPNLVNAFRQFNDRNFTILGVSLDREKSQWLNAIKQDQLNWTQISDLAYWNSASVSIFKFEGIPYNVLIDPKGIIIAEGLRGEALIRRLEELLK